MVSEENLRPFGGKSNAGPLLGQPSLEAAAECDFEDRFIRW
jgi:hypothetical protein